MYKRLDSLFKSPNMKPRSENKTPLCAPAGRIPSRLNHAVQDLHESLFKTRVPVGIFHPLIAERKQKAKNV